MFEAELKANPLFPMVINGKLYFEFEAIVSLNPKSTNFIDSYFTKQEIAQLCYFQEGVAITFKLKHSKQALDQLLSC